MQYAELPFKTLRPIHQPWGKREIVSAATKLPEGAAQMFPNIQSTPGKHLLVGRVGSAPTRNRCEKMDKVNLLKLKSPIPEREYQENEMIRDRLKENICKRYS